MKNILLTISVLISNRPETVEKCLKSLENLRNKVSSELILVDTGCGEQIRSVVEKYADTIIEFEWCGDFSKARNEGLKRARGEWFLYLDDDEWFEDTEEIEEFFVSSEYKNYGVACYMQRNYGNIQGTLYSDAIVSRMVRRGPNTCFKYSIHEVFVNFEGKYKVFSSYVHHYGYLFKSEKEKYEHSRRNIIPLLEEQEKEPYNLRHYAQLAQEYGGIGDTNRSIEISHQGIEMFHPKKTPNVYLNGLMANAVRGYCKIYEFENAKKYAEEFLKHPHLSEVGKARLSALLVNINYELEDYEHILEYIFFYEKCYKKQMEDRNAYAEQKNILIGDSFEDKVAYSAFCYGILAAIKLNKTEEAIRLFSYIDLNKKVLMIENQLLTLICDQFLLSEEEEYKEILNRLLEREELVVPIVNHFETKRKEDNSVIIKVGERWKNIQKDHWYFTYMRLLSSKASCERKEIFYRLWENAAVILGKSLELELWDIAEKDQINMAEVIHRIPYYKWERYVFHLCKRFDWENLHKLNLRISSLYPSKSEEISNHLLWWKICFTERLMAEINKQEELQIEALFEQYAKDVFEYYQRFYKKEILEQQQFLPANFQIASSIKRMQDAIQQEDYKVAIDKLKEIKEISSGFSQAVKQYVKKLEMQITEQEEERQYAKQQMENLAEALKAKIRFFMDQNDVANALQIILQLETFIPEDTELKILKEKCYERCS